MSSHAVGRERRHIQGCTSVDLHKFKYVACVCVCVCVCVVTVEDNGTRAWTKSLRTSFCETIRRFLGRGHRYHANFAVIHIAEALTRLRERLSHAVAVGSATFTIGLQHEVFIESNKTKSTQPTPYIYARKFVAGCL